MVDTKHKDARSEATEAREGEDRPAMPAVGNTARPGAAEGEHAGGQLGAMGASALHAVGETGAGALDAGRAALRGAVHATEELGTGIVGGVSHIATDLVHGVTDLGYEVRNGATGLIGAAGDIGSAAIGTVAHLLVDVVGGVRQVVAAAVDGHQERVPDGAQTARAEPMAASGHKSPPAHAGGVRPEAEVRSEMRL
jgi:hypothetical protein